MTHIHQGSNGTPRLGEIDNVIIKLKLHLTFCRELGIISIPYEDTHYDFSEGLLADNRRGISYQIDESFDTSFVDLNLGLSPEWIMDVKVVSFKSRRPITPKELSKFISDTSTLLVPLGILGQMLVCDQLRDQLTENTLYVSTMRAGSTLRDFQGNPVTSILMTGSNKSNLPIIDSARYDQPLPIKAEILFFFVM